MRYLELLVKAAQRLHVGVVGDLRFEHREQVEIAPARVEVADGQGAEEVQTSEPITEMRLDCAD